MAGGPAAISDPVFLAARASIWPSGLQHSRIEGFHEVAFVVQPRADEPGAQPAFKGCGAWADTPERRAQGMRGRTSLSGYDAMVFTVDPPSDDGFTNAGVPVPIEVSWFGADHRFYGSADMAPCPDGAMCPIYPPPAPCARGARDRARRPNPSRSRIWGRNSRRRLLPARLTCGNASRAGGRPGCKGP